MSELSSKDLDAIKEVHRLWINAELNGDVSQVVQLCTEDVSWVPPNAPPLFGKEAIAHYLRETAMDLKNIQVNDVVIRGSDSVAYLTGNYHTQFVVEGNLKTQGNLEMQEATGTHLWILRKSSRGAWLVAVVSWSSWEL